MLTLNASSVAQRWGIAIAGRSVSADGVMKKERSVGIQNIIRNDLSSLLHTPGRRIDIPIGMQVRRGPHNMQVRGRLTIKDLE